MTRLRMLVMGGVIMTFSLSACAGMQMSQTYQSAWRPMVKMNEPEPSKSVDSKTYTERLRAYHNRYQNNLNQCRDVAAQAAAQVPQSSILGDTLLGSLGGAVAGTVIGAATGNPGRGAAIGAASGGALGAGHGLWESGKEQKSQEWEFKSAYTRCMQHEGWHVLNPPRQ